MGEFDAAVYKAVECSDVDVLLFALQQLGTTLERDDAVAFKLEWLQLAVLSLDPSNPRITNHVPEVLKQVKTSMENLSPQIKTAHHAQVHILTHVINSILQQFDPR